MLDCSILLICFLVRYSSTFVLVVAWGFVVTRSSEKADLARAFQVRLDKKDSIGFQQQFSFSCV